MKKNILDLNHVEAKNFFLTQKAFTNIDLPPYFSFEDILRKIDKNFNEEILELSDLNQAKREETVNHILYGNKDGKHAWRKYQIIHPLIYVSLVNLVTKKDNWSLLKERFKIFHNIDNIKCESLPIIPTEKKKQKELQVSHWLTNIEKQSIALALEYKFLYHTDISNCYGSIYTHSLAWALHNKSDAKKKRNYDDLLGNQLDHHLQSMSHGQTNGIPQGSVLMDFIAEIILGYADLELTTKLNNLLKNTKYYILRYRDDYRIFVNDNSVGDIIFKCLNETLIDLGMSLSSSKTCLKQDIVSGSLKEDKTDSLKYGPVPKKLSKHELLRQLLIIQQISKNFPNSGTLINRLSKIRKATKTIKWSIYNDQAETLSAILTDIGYNNPKCFPHSMQLMSKYIPILAGNTQKKLFNKIREKIGTLSNVGLLEIWLQRVALALKLELNYKELLCKHTKNDRSQSIFLSNWVSNIKIKKILNTFTYVNQSEIKKLKPEIGDDEINIFTDCY